MAYILAYVHPFFFFGFYLQAPNLLLTLIYMFLAFGSSPNTEGKPVYSVFSTLEDPTAAQVRWLAQVGVIHGSPLHPPHPGLCPRLYFICVLFYSRPKALCSWTPRYTVKSVPTRVLFNPLCACLPFNPFMCVPSF